MIKEANAQFIWDTEEDAATIKWLRVVDYNGPHDRKTERAIEESDCSTGADTAGWLAGSHPLDQPLGKFAHLFLNYGFVSRAAQMKALEELAQVEEWHWARTMLEALQSEVG